MNYLSIPQARVTFGSAVTDGLIGGTIELSENTYWKADLTFRNAPAIYPSTVDIGTTVLIEAHDAATTSAYTTLFSGEVLTPDFTFDGATANVKLICVGKGYALNMMNCAEEYGTQSRNPTIDKISEILTDTSVGIIPKWVEKYRATANDSGYTLNTDYVENLAGSIPFISFPWKPADKCLDDLCDILTAQGGGSTAGPCWIVDNLGKLRVKRIGGAQIGWQKYYGGSQANATLVNGEDFFDGDFQKVGKQANTILYYCPWSRPSNGDWTENNHASWGTDGGGVIYSDEAIIKLVGEKSIGCHNSGATGCGFTFTFPTAIDFSYFTDQNRPSLIFDLAVGYTPITAGSGGGIYNNFFIRLQSSTGNYIYHLPGESSISKASSAGDVNFQHFDLPISLGATGVWLSVGSPDLTNITTVEIWVPGEEYVYLDGFHFGGAALLRIARQEFPDEVSAGRGTLGTTANPVRFKVLTDNIGKDDSLSASDDSGIAALMAKTELLKLNSTPINGKFSTPIIPDVLPGQLFEIGGDWRITKVTHNLSTMRSYFEVTNDVLNSHVRLRYEDVNMAYASIRPEYQDRQASSLKSGTMDIRVSPLEKAYNV